MKRENHHCCNCSWAHHHDSDEINKCRRQGTKSQASTASSSATRDSELISQKSLQSCNLGGCLVCLQSGKRFINFLSGGISVTERTEEMEGLQDRFVQNYNDADEKMAWNILALGNVMSFRNFVFPRCKCEFLCSPSLAPAQVEPGRGEGGEQGVRWWEQAEGQRGEPFLQPIFISWYFSWYFLRIISIFRVFCVQLLFPEPFCDLFLFPELFAIDFYFRLQAISVELLPLNGESLLVDIDKQGQSRHVLI